MTTPVINDQTLIRQTTPTTGITVAMPASTQDGDVLLLAILDTFAAPLTPPVGWTEFPWSPPSGTPVKILLTAGSTWPVPADWNSASNLIEVVGPGGRGGAVSGTLGGGGGGGGAYSSIANLALTPGTTVYAYRDSFDGSGNLSTHLPNLGSAYTLESGPGGLADMVLDGTGNLLPTSPTNAPDAASDISGTLGNTYTITMLFIPTVLSGAPGKGAYVDVAARIAGTDTWLIDITPFWNYPSTGIWQLGCRVNDSSNTMLFNASPDVTALIHTGVLNRATVDVSPSGTVWKVNGTTVATDSHVPDLPPDSVVLANFSNDTAASNILLDEASLTIGAPVSINYSLTDPAGAWFNGPAFSSASVAAARGANGVDGGVGGTGGQASAGTGSTKNNGGAGGSSGAFNYAAGGGGGAAGPDEDGSGGGDGGSFSAQGGGGGASNGGSNGQPGDAGGTGGNPNGGNGSLNNDADGGYSDALFDATHGLGGGGGGAGAISFEGGSSAGVGIGTGSGYGSGGGGSTLAFNAPGAPGIIVITYFPNLPVARMRTFWKVAASEPGTISFTKGAAADWIGGIYDIPNADVDTGAIVASGGVSTPPSTTSTNPGIDVGTVTGTLLVWLFSADSGPTFAAPPTGYLLASQDELPNNWAFGAASAPFPGSGPTGAVLASLTGSAATSNALIALRPTRLSILPTTCDDGIVGVDYVTESLLGVNGVAPYSYQLIGGALPPGVTLTNTVIGPNVRGVFGGNPTTSGVFDFAVRVTDATFATFDQPYTIIVNPSDSIVLGGHVAAGALGTLGVSSAGGLTGNSATGALGTLTPAASIALVGVTAFGALGALSPASATAIVGNTATAALGTLAPQTDIALPGFSAQSAMGSLSSSRTVNLVGIAATAELGRVWPPFVSDPNYVVRYTYRGNTVDYNPARGEPEGLP